MSDDSNIPSALVQLALSSSLTETPGIAVTGRDSLKVAESGSKDYLMIALGSEPADSVTLCLSVSDYCEATILTTSGNAVAADSSCNGAVAQLEFTPDNWSAVQLVAVQGRHDADYATASLPEGGDCSSLSSYVGDSIFTVTGRAVSNDSNYSGRVMESITGSVTDDRDRYSFVTSATNSGDFDTDLDGNGIEEADIFCSANIPPTLAGTGTYKALLVDGINRIACVNYRCTSSDALDYTDWVLQTDKVYFQSNGTTRAMNTVSADPFFEFNNASNNGFEGSGTYWTGLTADWQTGTICGTSWNATTLNGNVGNRGSIIATAIQSAATGACGNSSSYTLVCIQQ